jgi:putative addiction module component (TIGR02574 family)
MDYESQQLLRTALSLPESDRAEIAALLIDSLESESDGNVDAAWAAEIRRRIASIDNGDVTLIPWNTVMDEMRARQNG